MIRRSIILFLIIAYIYGCNDQPTDTNSSITLYPLEVGNSWSYESKYYDSTMTFISTDSFSESIVDDTTLDNQLLFELKTPLYKSPACCDHRYYLFPKADGIYEKITSYNSTILYKYPVSINSYYIHHSDDTTYVLSDNDTVKCKAGVFNCILYQQKVYVDSLSSYNYKIMKTYVAKGIGKIMFQSYMYKKDHSLKAYYVYELTSYNIK